MGLFTHTVSVRETSGDINVCRFTNEDINT